MYVLQCPICGLKFRDKAHERLHAFTHIEKRTANLHVRIEPSRLEALRRVAKDENVSLTDVVDQAIDFTYGI